MTDNKISRKLELELKPQYKFFPSSEDRSSTQLSTGEFQAKFFDADGQSYNCEDNKAWLFFGPPPQIYITSEFNKDEAERLNAHYDYSRIGLLHRKGLPIVFLPRKVSLNDGPCVDIVSLESSSSSSMADEKSDKVWLRWTPKEEHIVVTGGSSTKMKQIIFHLFNFVYFHDGDGSPRDETIADPDGLVASKTKPLSLNFNCGEWEITISQNPEHKPKHVGRIQRKDGGVFKGEEVKKCLETLGFIFSLVRGAWCKPVCLVGYDASGERVWESLSPIPKFKPSIPSQLFFSRDTKLESATSFLMDKMHSEAEGTKLQRALRRVIREYVGASSCKDCNQGRDIEDGIFNVKKVIEYISRYFIVTEKKELAFSSEHAEKNIYADVDDLNELSRSLGISEIQPDNPPILLSILQKRGAKQTVKTFNDFYKKLSDIRNAVAHANSNEKDDNFGEIKGEIDDKLYNERCPSVPLAKKQEIYFLGLTFVERFIHAAYRVPWATAEKPAPALND